MFYFLIFTFSRYDLLPKEFQSVHEFQEAWFSLKISRNHVLTLMQKSSCAWNTDTKMSRKLTGLSRKSYFILYCRSYLKNANWTWKLQSDFHDFIKFSAKRQLLLLLLPTTSATSPSSYDVKTFEMKFTRWIVSVNHCWKCNKTFYLDNKALFLNLILSTSGPSCSKRR